MKKIAFLQKNAILRKEILIAGIGVVHGLPAKPTTGDFKPNFQEYNFIVRSTK